MSRGQVALLVPSVISDSGVKKLAGELKRAGAQILQKDEELVAIKWDAAAKAAISKGVSLQAYYTDIIKAADLKKLPPHAAQIGALWNWSINTSGKHLTDAQVMKCIADLQLEIRGNTVYDRISKRSLGDIKSKEESSVQGNWVLRQERSSTYIPAWWYGAWIKLWCKSTTWTNDSYQSLVTVDYILAEVTGAQHFGSRSKNNASMAYASDWAYFWFWELGDVDGKAHSYARKGNSTREMTNNIV